MFYPGFQRESGLRVEKCPEILALLAVTVIIHRMETLFSAEPR
jgi:hypothetical protein